MPGYARPTTAVPAVQVFTEPTGDISANTLQAALTEIANEKSTFVSPTFTGTVTIPTPTTNFSAATKAYVDNYAALPRTILTQSASAYTLALSDAGDIILMNFATANTLTIPTNATASFSIGTTVDILQYNAGQTTVAGAVGVTVNGTPGLKLRTRYSSCTLIKINTDEWVVVGDLSL